MNLLCVCTFCVTLLIERVFGKIKIGGLFCDESHSVNIQKFAFLYAIQVANEKLSDVDLQFEAEIRTYEYWRNSFTVGKNVCELMSESIIGIFGPQFGDSLYVVQDICDLKEIPHVQTRSNLKQSIGTCSVNFYPYPTILSELFLKVVREWNWNKYTILYEDSESLMRISPLLKPNFNSTVTVKLKKILKDGSSYRSLLREIKESDDYNIVLDCSTEILPEILKQAQQVGLMGSDHSFLITNLDFHTLNIEPYQYGGTNITSFRLFTPADISDTMLNLTKFIKETANVDIKLTTLPLEATLIYDAVIMFTQAILEVLDNESKRTVNPISCDSREAWQHGFSIINYMKLSVLEGLTGLIKFDHQGFRTFFNAYILELKEEGLIEIGKWNINRGLKIYNRDSLDVEINRINSLRNTTMNVIIPLTSPYGMRVRSHEKLSGNKQYEGFCVDLIEELSRMNNNFSINFIIATDGKSGSATKLENKTVIWDGMIGAIIRGEADLACGDLTVTREREEVVDITAVFMNLGIAILYKKPQSEPPGFFSFLSPFKSEVWILVITAYVGVSLTFFIIGRISPYEWTNPYPCVQDPDEMENQFTLSNSFWFTIGALMQQGSEVAPISVSTRLAAGVWWFFTLIMVSCYTANLAAFLTTENPSEEFSNMDELAQQTEIKYGAKRGGTTFQFFNESSESLHKRMFNYMTVHADDVLTESSGSGVDRAVKEKYAFLMESSQIEYETERQCTLTQIGKPIDDKGYGIAMKKGSWYLGLFSQSILKMQEGGKLSDLKRKWWKEKYAGSCTVNKNNDAETLGLMNLGGVFIVLGGGAMVAILIAIIEKLVYVWSSSKAENVPMKEKFKKELKFFLRCRGTTKTVATIKNFNNSDRSTS